MEKKLSKDFKSKIFQLFDDEDDRAQLFRALQDYQQVRSVRTLVKDLKEITTTPEHLLLYDEIRPFIMPKHQAEYDRIIPKPPSERSHIIRLVRNPGSEGLGFKFVGGVEYGVGIFVCEVLPRSQADKKGLKAGDEIIRVNGYSLDQATNGEVLAAMKLHKTLMLKVKSVGMFPIKNSAAEEISWKLVKSNNKESADKTRGKFVEKDRKVFANLESGMKLGCGIGTGSDGEPGIFVHKITKGSMSENLGFKIGDQLIDVNGESCLDVTHSEAVVVLKSSRQLTITLRTKETVKDKPSSHSPLTTDESYDLNDESYDSPVMPSSPFKGRSNVYVVGGSMGYDGTMGTVMPAAGDRDMDDEDNSRARGLVEDRIEPKREERIAAAPRTTNNTWGFSQPKTDEPDEEEVDFDEEEEEEEQVVMPKVNRFAKIIQEEDAMEREKRERDGTYVPSNPGDQMAWWNGNAYNLFTKRQIDGKALRKVEVSKDNPLDIELEGGAGTPLGGKLVISEVFAGGAAAKCGELGRGDQIMMVEGKTFIDISRPIAEKFLQKCMESPEGRGKLKMIVAIAPIKAYEDEITFF